MSWMRYMTMHSFRQQNPDWEIYLYTAGSTIATKTWSDAVQQDFHSYKGRDYIPELEKLGVVIKPWTLMDREFPNMCASHKSNFFKWHLLGTKGGIYADLDILWIKPMDSFLQVAEGMDITICCTKYLSIGLLASEKGSAFFYDAFLHGKKHYDTGHYQSCGVENVYTMLYGRELWNGDGIDWGTVAQKPLLKDIATKYDNPKIFNIPVNWIYPILSLEMQKMFSTVTPIPKESIGLHWYAGHPLAQKYNNLLDDSNYKEYNNTFTKAIT